MVIQMELSDFTKTVHAHTQLPCFFGLSGFKIITHWLLSLSTSWMTNGPVALASNLENYLLHQINNWPSKNKTRPWILPMHPYYTGLAAIS